MQCQWDASNLVSDARGGKGRSGNPDEDQESTINQSVALAIAGNQFNLLRTSGVSLSSLVCVQCFASLPSFLPSFLLLFSFNIFFLPFPVVPGNLQLSRGLGYQGRHSLQQDLKPVWAKSMPPAGLSLPKWARLPQPSGFCTTTSSVTARHCIVPTPSSTGPCPTTTSHKHPSTCSIKQPGNIFKYHYLQNWEHLGRTLFFWCWC